MSNFRREATINSALWAAYADALGFITELANSKNTIKTRVGSEVILDTVSWRRKLDGIYGTQVQLPQGTYSDDTQLRLSTSRAINGAGYFDVEAFAKCELPVWLSYALGAGRGTKVATNNLIKKSVNWYSNFYANKSGKYVNGGGNGAAMRVQPHVWSAPDLSDLETYIIDVIKNSIVTHGHPRAIAGAILHSLSLARVLRQEKVSLDTLKDDALICSRASFFIKQDDMLETFWSHQWEAETGQTLDEAFSAVTDELLADLEVASKWMLVEKLDYRLLSDMLGLKDEAQRGSGSKTALAASLLLVKSYRLNDPKAILVDIVNELHTDTDTIATMFGALYGVYLNKPPVGHIQDSGYIIREAERMYELSARREVSSFVYPDALTWFPTRSSLDNSEIVNNKLAIALFGELTPLSDAFEDKKKEHLYKWYSTQQGFSILLKRRLFPSFPDNQLASFPDTKSHLLSSDSDYQSSVTESNEYNKQNHTVHDMKSLIKEARECNYDDEIIGKHIKILANKKNYSIESVIAYSSIIANELGEN
ncbi:ADP-ribosylglycohydrolase family protein [Vibrio atlanticus]|uniref:ADP-ribosyl-[dinitrogen reductase] glycohydrolase n=1 Tax=Vibrio atlanticus TaxID=693153 RepID=A0A1C3IN77_9VIBR|nr:ADP-ribosylglycohydrolase family protein [Vibrio atlanticus]SBS62863.1 ADP-ribosyl-[dinitrogen reductase] glycohydrolase [Vibrio atlanticus]